MGRGAIAHRSADLAAGSATIGGFVFVKPIDGVVDDAANLNAIFALNAYKNIVVMVEGDAGEEFQILTQQNVPPGTMIWGTPGTNVHVNLPGASLLNSAFAAYSIMGVPIAMTANNTPGTRVIQLAAAPVVGSWLLLSVNPLFGTLFQVASVAGAGPFNVTLTRTVLYQCTAGTSVAVTVTTLAENVTIRGNGMRIHGTAGGSYVMGLVTRRCTFSDLILDGSDVGPVASYQSGLLIDNGGLECRVANVVAVGAFGAVANQVGMQLIGEGHEVENVRTSRNVSGFVVNDATGLMVNVLESYDNTVNGLVVTSDNGAAFYPSESNAITTGLIYGNGADGIQIGQGALCTVFEGVFIRENGGSGVALSAVTQPPQSVYFIGCEFQGNTSNGFTDVAGARGIHLIGCDISDNGQAGLSVFSQVFAKNLTSRSGNPTSIVLVNSGECWVDGYDVTMTQAGSQAFNNTNAGILYADRGRVTLSAAGVGFQLNGTSRTFVKGARFTVNANSQLVLLNGAAGLVCCLEDADCDGTALGGSVGVNAAAANTIRLGERVKFDALANPFNFNAGALWSRSITGVAGTLITIPAGLVVVVPFTDMGNSDRVTLTRIVQNAAAVPVPMPLVVTLAATNFTVTATAGDLGAVYAYCIH